MKKRKITSIVAKVLVFGYVFTMWFLYSTCAENQNWQFRSTEEYFKEMIHQMQYIRDMSRAVSDISYGYQSLQYPMVITVTDTEENVISSSSNNLTIQVINERGECTEDIYINLDKWINEDVEETFETISRKSGPENINHVYVKSVLLHHNGTEYIPVSMHCTTSKDGDADIKFTDYAPNTFFDNSSPLTAITFYPVTLGKTEHYKKCVKKLEEKNLEFREEYISNLGGSIGTVGAGQGFSDPNETGYVHVIKNENDNNIYYVFLTQMSDRLYNIIKSKEFINYFLFISAFFLIFGAIAEAAVIIIFNKNERLEKARAAFINAAAHELKTPLAIISNQCECVLENIAPEKNIEYISSVYDESKKMSRMVKRLLEYNKLHSTDRIQKEKFSLSDCIPVEIEKYAPLIEQKNITLTFEKADETQINANREMMSLVIDNFLSNAVKFTTENGKIEIKCEKHGKGMRLSVHNTGEKIAANDGKHIWEEFYKCDKSRSRQDDSTGMGLAVSRTILELHKFSYGYKNEKDGVTFYFIAK